MQLSRHHAYIPERLGEIGISYHDNFIIHKDGEDIPVKKMWVDKKLHNLSKEKLALYLANNNYLDVNQLSDGQYRINAKSRIKGGGPASAYWGYCATKAFIYGLGAIGAGTALVGAAVTAPALAPVYAGSSIVLGAAAGTGGTVLVATGVGTGIGFAAAAGSTAAITATTVLAETAVATAATSVAATGTLSGAVVAVEGLSLAVGGALAAIPWLP